MFQRTLIQSVALAASLLAAIPAFAAEYSVDKDHSNVGFTIRHLVSKVPGSFKDYEGTFNFDEKDLKSSKVQFTIKAASIDTANAKRDEHLRSADFFNVEKNPTISFVSKKITGSGKHFKIEGDMTMLGVTKPVTFNAEYMGAQKDPWGNMKAGFSASSKINRKDFGMVFNKVLDSGSLMLGEDVTIQLDIEAAQKAAAAAAAASNK